MCLRSMRQGCPQLRDVLHQPVERSYARGLSGMVSLGEIARFPVIYNFSSPSALSHIEAAAVLEALGQPLLVLDADGCVSYASSEARRLLGTPMERLRGRPFHHLFSEARLVHGEVLRMLHEAPETDCRLAVTESAQTARQFRLRLSLIDDPENLPHVLVHLRTQRGGRRSPTGERVIQKLPEGSSSAIFAA